MTQLTVKRKHVMARPLLWICGKKCSDDARLGFDLFHGAGPEMVVVVTPNV